MTKLIPHPKCKDLGGIYPDPIIFKFIRINTKNTELISQHINETLKSLKGRSFYNAVKIVSEIENTTEQNEILQILYSVATYSENNHSTNLLTLWIEDIYIKKKLNNNQFINKDSGNLKYSYNVIIELGFEYEAPPIKKEPLW